MPNEWGTKSGLKSGGAGTGELGAVEGPPEEQALGGGAVAEGPGFSMHPSLHPGPQGCSSVALLQCLLSERVMWTGTLTCPSCLRR